MNKKFALPIFVFLAVAAFVIWSLRPSHSVEQQAVAPGQTNAIAEQTVESSSTGVVPRDEILVLSPARSSAEESHRYLGAFANLRGAMERVSHAAREKEQNGVYQTTTIFRAPGLKYEYLRFDELFTANPDENEEAKLLSQEAYVADHFLVRLKDEQAGLVDALLNKFDQLKVRHELSTGEHLLIEFPFSETSESDQFAAWAGRLSAHGLEVEKDLLARPTQTIPADPEYPQQWALENDGETGGVLDADIDAALAWDIETGSSDVIVAVLDTGANLSHPDLVSQIWRTGAGAAERTGFDATNGTFQPFDVNGHGTSVAGLIGARSNNGRFIAGVNWDVQLMIVKVFTDIVIPGEPNEDEEDPDNSNDEETIALGFLSDVLSGLDFAVSNGASIVNMSLGFTGGGTNDDSDSFFLALRNARDSSNQGVLAVIAAGNSAVDNDNDEEERAYPASYTLSNIISVAASNSSDELASFSNFGLQSVDLAAPGDGVLSLSVEGGTVEASGTSFAAPYVAGVAALLKAQDANRTYLDIKEAILNSVDQKPAFTDTTMTGGRLNAYNALLYSGSGVVRSTGLFVNPEGNGDSFWTQEEAASVDVSLKNFGGATANNVSVTVEVESGNATVTSAETLDLSNSLASGEEIFISDAFEITAGTLEQFAFEETVRIRITVTYGDGGTQTDFIDVVFFQNATISGVVTDGSDGSTIEGASINIIAQIAGRDLIEESTLTDENGFYSITLFTGFVSINAVAEGYEDADPRIIDLNPVEPDQIEDFVLGQGNFVVTPDPVSVTVPPNEQQRLALSIQNLSTFGDSLEFQAEVSEDLEFVGESKMFGLSGVGRNVVEVQVLNQITLEILETIEIQLPAGNFATDCAAISDRLWILALTNSGAYAIHEYLAEDLSYIRSVPLYLGLTPFFNGEFIANDDVSVETIFAVPYPDEDAPGGYRQELAAITHDIDEIFNVNLYRIDPDSLDIPTREVLIADLGINFISWFDDLKRRAGAYGGDRNTFFYGRGVSLYEYEITGPNAVNELKQSSIFGFQDGFTFFFEDLEFNPDDVNALAFLGIQNRLYILLDSQTRNLLAVDWDGDVLLDIYDSPGEIDRITSSSGSIALSWLRFDTPRGSIPEGESQDFPITLDTTELSLNDARTGFIRFQSPESDVEQIVSVSLTVGSLGFDSTFVGWYQSIFAADPTEELILVDSDGGGNFDALEYVTGTNPRNPGDDRSVPTIIKNPQAEDEIYLKFRQRLELDPDVVRVQGRSTLLDEWRDLEEGVDYEVISREIVDTEVEILTIAVSTESEDTGFFRLLITL